VNTFVQLFESYRSLWSNRSFIKDEELTEEYCKSLLYEAIEKELRDEMTHPRTRQSPEIKFFYAIKRIINSNLSEQEKLSLIHIYISVMEQIKK
jgi:hypothetical protein